MKKVIKKTAFSFSSDFPGLRAVNIMAQSHPIEPFLVFTEFWMDRPVFGPHPHAGISVMTYLLSDSKTGFLNRDSAGDRSNDSRRPAAPPAGDGAVAGSIQSLLAGPPTTPASRSASISASR